MRVITIFGGPGTGKTTKLAELFCKAVKKYGVKNVAFVSYTKTQVQRGKSAAGKIGRIKRKKLKKFKTLHSMSRENYEYDTQVLDDDMVGRMSLYLGRDMQSVMRGIDYMNNTLTDDDAVGANRAGTDTIDFQKLKRFYETAKNGSSTDGARTIDFSDMIADAVASKHKVDCKVAFVDEAQDLSLLQWQAVYTFFRDVDTLYVAGDPNQALYRFAGGASNYMLRMRTDETIFLDRSHRCSESVMLMAERVWEKMKDRAGLPLPSEGHEGFAVFYPDLNIGKKFLNPILSLLQKGKKVLVLANTYRQLSNVKERLFGNFEIPHSFLSGRCKYRWRNRKENVVVFSTVHQAKGLEADFVLYDASCGETGKFSDFGKEDEKWQDYWRVVYTAVTRARSMLVVCELSTPRHGSPTSLETLYYAKYGFGNFKDFCCLKPSYGQGSKK